MILEDPGTVPASEQTAGVTPFWSQFAFVWMKRTRSQGKRTGCLSFRTRCRSTSEAIRAAIAEHIEKRRRDPAFQARLQRILDEERVVLERLAQ